MLLMFYFGDSACAPRNTHKIRTQCRCEYGYKNHESFGSLKLIPYAVLAK